MQSGMNFPLETSYINRNINKTNLKNYTIDNNVISVSILNWMRTQL